MAKNPTRNQKRRKNWYNIDPTCQICALEILKFDDSTIEHIVPRWLGGHSWFWNVALAHYDCNQDENKRAYQIHKQTDGNIQKTREIFLATRPNLNDEFWYHYKKRRFKGDK